ncbi:efflux RND transporter periplasmic adaptor subunit [Ralstonia syzygii]|uniref:Heavy metal cation tricomponent efflux membrane fusion protein NimB (CzcB-like) n=1 Tax=Ralstonia syzygii R24 TaxID=907261 RepID=G3A7T6_9RALS|nr:efflux RND transporter periplasmic adaptor subunit [Ralstonia syzygii]CCA86572.1 heavy metal cation tricomponent efflux membrane fusion protein NimB (CzcB-like) [Ralstonia syzygii R24]
MFLKRILMVGASIALTAFPLRWATAQPAAQAASLSAEQARALGVRFSLVAASGGLEVGTHARVVFKPDAQYVVAAPYAGMVPRVLVSLGQTIRPSQPLAGFLSPQLFEASRALTEANSQARLAQQSLARDKALYDDGIIAGSRWQATQARAAEADAMAKARRAELASAGIAFIGAGGEAQLIASRGGVVSEVNAVPGARVEAAAPLFRIVDPASLELDLLVGRDVPVPTTGDRIEIVQRGASATVIGVAPAGDGTAGVRVRASLERRGDLRAGESVNVTLKLRGSRGAGASGLVRVPAAALAYVSGVPGVFVATDKGFHFQEVAVASTDDAVAVVRANLPTGTRVAVAGVGALKGLLAGEQ